LALALAVVLALDPWAVLAPGFWLSFGAVALIFYTGTGKPHSRGWLAQWGTVQWAVCVGLAPLLLVLFRQVSVVSPIANAVAIPLVSLVMTPLTLAGAVLPVDALLVAAHALAEVLMRFLQSLAGLDLAVWQQHAPAAWTLPLALVGAAWMLAPRGFPSRTCGAVAMLPMFAVTPPLPAHGEAWITFLDVGQGTSVLVRTRDHALLYDAGPSWGPDSDAGARVVVPYLRGEGLSHLDALVISHDDTDHSGGASSVLEAMAVGQIVSSLQPDHPMLDWTGYRIPCQAGSDWDWNAVRFTLLHPAGEHYANPWIRPNDRSCVLRIQAQGTAVLLAGDMERTTEHELLNGKVDALRAEVLLAPHHGSGSSSSSAFVNAVSPRLVVFTVGYRNRFGHPHPNTVQRYREQGAEILRSDVAGAVTVRIGAKSMALASYRESARRYWNTQ
jgi:competence protein ComEC